MFVNRLFIVGILVFIVKTLIDVHIDLFLSVCIFVLSVVFFSMNRMQRTRKIYFKKFFPLHHCNTLCSFYKLTHLLFTHHLYHNNTFRWSGVFSRCFFCVLCSRCVQFQTFSDCQFFFFCVYKTNQKKM